ncbi:MAG: hypothetical protein K2V38_01455, partial [Gemmataceae bacterium]|nr:hypothetical protein [Gemmataceae bacterium]
MSTPASPPAHDPSPIGPPPLVHRVFGEPRFHTDADICALCFAADGRLFSVDEGGVLQHWSADGRPLARHFLSDLETLWRFGPGGRLLVSGNEDLGVWDAESGQLLARTADQAGDWATALAVAPDGRTVASGHDGGSLRLWDATTGHLAGEFRAHPRKAVSAVAFSPDGRFVATAGEDRSVRVWDARTHRPVAELKSHTDRIPALVWG